MQQDLSDIKCPSIDNGTLCSSFGEQTPIQAAGIPSGKCDAFYETLALNFCPFATIPDTIRYIVLAMVFLSTCVGCVSALFLILLFLSDRALWKVNHSMIVNLAVVDFLNLAVVGSYKIYVLVGMMLNGGG